ncbi:hypothetical protein F5883DRAFT_120510 [Diaporthe sp. PMI_573]|nr:hypothetical protein F5883DRAFT_120510 [Diaporthaceae sp. PMI_573]
MRYLFLVATSSSRLSVRLSICNPPSSCDPSAVRVPALGRAKRERPSERIRAEQSRAAQSSAAQGNSVGCARSAPSHCLILGWRRMPFFAANPQHHQNRTVPYRTAPHLHGTAPFRSSLRPPALHPAGTVSFCFCAPQPVIPARRWPQFPSVLPSGGRCQHPQNLSTGIAASAAPHSALQQGPLRCSTPSLPYHR